jgi:oligoribonuclease
MSALHNDTDINFLWVDLEMTGLDATTDRIVEVAAIATHFNLNPLGQYETGVLQDATEMTNLFGKNEFARNRPTETAALLQTSLRGKQEQAVEQELLNFIQQHFGDEPVYLAGNSIHADRGFIKQWWPTLHNRLHYRMLDISSFKLWWIGSGRFPYVKKELHTALSDINESIAEFQFYRKEIEKNHGS